MGKAGLAAPRFHFAPQEAIIGHRGWQTRKKRAFESFLETVTVGFHGPGLRHCTSMPGCRSRFREEVSQHQRRINEHFREKPQSQSEGETLTNSENAEQLHAVAMQVSSAALLEKLSKVAL